MEQMPKMELPYWLLNTVFTGREEGEDGDEGEDDGEGDGSSDDDSSGSDDQDGKGGSGSDNEDDYEELKGALAKERAKAKRLERENNRLKRKKADNDGAEAQEEQKAIEEAQAKLKESNTKVERLATKLRNDARDAAILAEARKLKFIDPTDALTDAIRSQVEIDQDDEDPSDIEVDLASVTDAVKKLANSKKHLIGKPNDGEPSGGRFSSRRRQDDDAGDDLTEVYPSLR